MDLTFTEEQLMMQKMVRDFAQNELALEVERMEKEDRFPSEIIKRMGELGLMGIPIPKKYGGSNMDFISYIIAINELARVSATVGLILSVHTSVGTNPILYFGNDKQKDYYLPKLASGEFLGGFALTEANAGSDAASLKMRAVKDGNDFLINGSKAFITNGSYADTYITFARTDNQDGTKGISAFIIEKGTPGLEVGKQENKMGLRGSSTTELIFNNCRVSKSQLLGEQEAGFKTAMANLNIGRIGIAAQALGIAEAALKSAIAYANEREQFGKPIAYNQGISFKLADMATEVEAARLLTYRAASLVDKKQQSIKEVSMAKMYASRAAVRTSIEAVQVLGGYGYTKDYPVERFFRDAKVTEIYEGTNEIQHIVIANQLLRS